MNTWPIKKLGEIISFQKGKKMTVASDGEPYIGIDGLRTNRYAVYTQEKNGLRCKQDDVLLVWDGAHAGTVGTGLSGFVGSTVVKVLHDDSLENKFLFYLLKLFQEKIRAAAQGAAIPHLNKAFINSVKIPLPPLTIQKQIVERLDKIAEAQKLNDELIQKTDELFQSLLHSLIRANSGIVKKLGDIAEIVGGFAFKSVELSNKKISEDYLPVIKIGNVLKSGDIDTENVQYHKFDNSLTKYLINDGDILVAMTGATVGKVVSSHANNLLLNQRVGLIRSHSEGADQHFLGIVLETMRFYDYCQKTAGGGAQGNISPTQIMLYEIPLPPLATQKQIVAKLSAVQDYKKQLIAKRTKLKELFDSVLHKSMKNE